MANARMNFFSIIKSPEPVGSLVPCWVVGPNQSLAPLYRGYKRVAKVHAGEPRGSSLFSAAAHSELLSLQHRYPRVAPATDFGHGLLVPSPRPPGRNVVARGG